jgi:hypothetical protein
MLRDYLLGTRAWYSNKCALTWKVKVTKYNRSLYQLSPSMRRTEGIGSGLWLATPTATDAQEGMRKSTQQKEGSRHSITLRDDIARIAMMLPTPVVKPTEDVVIVPVAIKDGMTVPAMLPTPDSHMERGVAKEWKPIRPSGAHASFPLNEAVAGTKTGLKLQPGFALWMMGYPTDWCDLRDGEMPPSKARGTRGSRKLQ